MTPNIRKIRLPGAAAKTQPHAARFIVTIYGDLVEPRGGALWIGSLIAICAKVGISESLVRTAVSRLVSKGRLVGARKGRRSYYRLSEAAQLEFSAASRVIFGPPEKDDGWIMAHQPDAARANGLLRAGFAKIGNGHFIGPARLKALSGDALQFDVASQSTPETLRAWAARYWDLKTPAAAYREFLQHINAFAQMSDHADQDQLIARLLLVHEYRLIVLADPRLAGPALPAGWPGDAARVAFARTYLALCRGANAAVCQTMEDGTGPLPETAAEVKQREVGLRAHL